MKKPDKQYIFREVEGVWRNVSSDSETLADTLRFYNLIVDDMCEFARFKIESQLGKITIYYRVYGGKITLTIWSEISKTT